MQVKVKFERREWLLTESDVFLDNGMCVLLVTQSYQSDWSRANPRLTKALVTRWKKEGILYTTPALSERVKKDYSHSGVVDRLTYYKVDIKKLADSGIGVMEIIA